MDAAGGTPNMLYRAIGHPTMCQTRPRRSLVSAKPRYRSDRGDRPRPVASRKPKARAIRQTSFQEPSVSTTRRRLSILMFHPQADKSASMRPSTPRVTSWTQIVAIKVASVIFCSTFHPQAVKSRNRRFGTAISRSASRSPTSFTSRR